MKLLPAAQRAAVRGLSLIELLLVIAIVAVLGTLSVPAISSIMETNNLSQGGQILSDQISQARQIASVRNRSVEVRLIRTAATQGFQAIQLWMSDGAGNMTQASKIVYLPTGVAISSNVTLSSLFATKTNPMCFTGTMPATGAAANAPYASIRIRSSGEIEPVPALADRQYLFVTLLPARWLSATALPANYVMEQVDPNTGNVELFRP